MGVGVVIVGVGQILDRGVMAKFVLLLLLVATMLGGGRGGGEKEDSTSTRPCWLTLRSPRDGGRYLLGRTWLDVGEERVGGLDYMQEKTSKCMWEAAKDMQDLQLAEGHVGTLRGMEGGMHKLTVTLVDERDEAICQHVRKRRDMTGRIGHTSDQNCRTACLLV
eukprot:762430-Hanusia_phi.AAC.2